MLSRERRESVQRLIDQVSKVHGLSLSESRTLIHKYICGGKCDWYRRWSKEAGFDRLDITEEQEKQLGDLIREIMKVSSPRDARADIHEYICPGHPRPSD